MFGPSSGSSGSAAHRMKSILCPGGHIPIDEETSEMDLETGGKANTSSTMNDLTHFLVHEEAGSGAGAGKGKGAREAQKQASKESSSQSQKLPSKESSQEAKEKSKHSKEKDTSRRPSQKEQQFELTGGTGLADEAQSALRSNSKESSKSDGEHVRQFDSVDSQESNRPQKANTSLPPGRMRVKVIGAQNLPTMSQFFKWPSADTYAVIVLEDTTLKQQSPVFRTRVCHNSLHPRWSDDFWFALSKNAGNINLHVEVWHCIDSQAAKGHDDILLGQCDIAVNEHLKDKEGVAISLPEQGLIPPAAPQASGEEKPAADVSSFFSRQSKKGPSLLIELAWEPTLETAGFIGNPRYCSRLLRSAQAMRVARVICFGGAGAMLIVCVHGRWICHGRHWNDCEQIQVAGTGACSVMAAMAVITACFIHFFGSSGLFGNDWTGSPVSWMDLLVSELELREGSRFSDSMGESTLRMQINHDTLARFNVHVATNILPPVSHYMLRVMSLCAYLVTYLVCFMAGLLAWLQTGHGNILGEAFFINLCALLSLTFGVITSYRESNLLILEDRERWRVVDELGQATRGHLSERMYSQGSPQFILEELARKGVENLTSLQQQAENFTQPLKDAWQPFQQRLGLDVGAKRVAKSIDGLLASTGATTPLNQPLLDRHGGATSPTRRAGFPCKMTPTTPLSNHGSGHEMEAHFPEMANGGINPLFRNTSNGFANDDEELVQTPQARTDGTAEPKAAPCCGCT